MRFPVAISIVVCLFHLQAQQPSYLASGAAFLPTTKIGGCGGISKSSSLLNNRDKHSKKAPAYLNRCYSQIIKKRGSTGHSRSSTSIWGAGFSNYLDQLGKQEEPDEGQQKSNEPQKQEERKPVIPLPDVVQRYVKPPPSPQEEDDESFRYARYQKPPPQPTQPTTRYERPSGGQYAGWNAKEKLKQQQQEDFISGTSGTYFSPGNYGGTYDNDSTLDKDPWGRQKPQKQQGGGQQFARYAKPQEQPPQPEEQAQGKRYERYTKPQQPEQPHQGPTTARSSDHNLYYGLSPERRRELEQREDFMHGSGSAYFTPGQYGGNDPEFRKEEQLRLSRGGAGGGGDGGGVPHYERYVPPSPPPQEDAERQYERYVPPPPPEQPQQQVDPRGRQQQAPQQYNQNDYERYERPPPQQPTDHYVELKQEEQRRMQQRDDFMHGTGSAYFTPSQYGGNDPPGQPQQPPQQQQQPQPQPSFGGNGNDHGPGEVRYERHIPNNINNDPRHPQGPVGGGAPDDGREYNRYDEEMREFDTREQPPPGPPPYVGSPPYGGPPPPPPHYGGGPPPPPVVDPNYERYVKPPPQESQGPNYERYVKPPPSPPPEPNYERYVKPPQSQEPTQPKYERYVKPPPSEPKPGHYTGLKQEEQRRLQQREDFMHGSGGSTYFKPSEYGGN